jgi:putative alpha-1,2-mannosidase
VCLLIFFSFVKQSHKIFLQNEDCGQMSAWYIFSALGFYPVNPVSGEYVVGSYETFSSFFLDTLL